MITVAVIGIGVMGNHHARLYQKIPDAKLVGLVDIDSRVAIAASKKFGVPTYVLYREMLEKHSPQVVSIAVPASFHEEVTIAALESGSHVIVEKPLATTLEAGARMITHARRFNRQLMVGHIERFNPVIQALKAKLLNGLIGKPYQIICRRSHPFPSRIRDVGIILDTAIHDIDVISFLTDQIPVHIYADINYYLNNTHEDTLHGSLHYKNGCDGFLEVNWISPLKTREVLAYGESGLLYADTVTHKIFLHQKDKTPIAIPTPQHDPLQSELQAFLQSVKNKTPVAISPQQSFLALFLALALLKSGNEKKSQMISFDPEALINKLGQ